jgi:hypothetical protein
VKLDDHVRAVLEQGNGPDNRNLKNLLRMAAAPNHETALCDLKAEFDPQHSWPDLAKDIVAMSNSGGGILILGVYDDGKRVGLQRSLTREFDAARINGRIESRAPGARLQTTYTEIIYYRLRYGFLTVRSNDQLVVFEKEWRRTGSTDKKQVVRPGVLYVRGVAETRPAKQVDLSLIVQRLIQTGSQQLLARIERTAAIPLSAELIVANPETPERGLRLVDAGHGQPVRIVDEAHDAVPIYELISPEAPFTSTQHDFASAVRGWRAHPSERASRLTLIDWYLKRDEIEVNDDMAEFALLSAGDDRGYGMYWASLLSSKRLETFLERELEEMRYPMRHMLPHLVGSFRWPKRKDLLEPRLWGLQSAAGPAERIIDERSFDRFRRRGRVSFDSFQFDGVRYSINELATNQANATAVFEKLLTAEHAGEAGNRPATHQLDILLHSREA